MDGSGLSVPAERIERSILVIRGQKVMLDSDLAELYGVETSMLNRAVNRNRNRFPADFMFQLTKEEFDNLRFQSGTSSPHWGGRRYPPYAFTPSTGSGQAEQGVAMLSSVLRSDRAVEVNIEIMRAFVRLRRLLASNEELARRLDEHDERFQLVFEAIRQLMTPPEPEAPPRRLGFPTKDGDA